jgi:hypothetical protein
MSWQVPTDPKDPFDKSTWKHTYANYQAAQPLIKKQKNERAEEKAAGKNIAESVAYAALPPENKPKPFHLRTITLSNKNKRKSRKSKNRKTQRKNRK